MELLAHSTSVGRRTACAIVCLWILATIPGCRVEPEPLRQAALAERFAWHPLEPGLELGELNDPSTVSSLRVLRIDPALFELRLLNASASNGGRLLTARDWCEAHGLVGAINAGMYQQDYRTSVSLMRTREHVNNPRLTRHRSVLAFDALVPGVPPVKIIDLECDAFDDWRERYGTFVQSIRMVSCQGRNVWEPQQRKSSTAAIGTDGRDRVLFVHLRSPASPHELIDLLLELPLDLERLMYAEGGPEAQLFVRGGGGVHEFVGALDLPLDDSSAQAWPVPNVIGIARRAAPPVG